MNKLGRTASESSTAPVGPSAESDWTLLELSPAIGSAVLLTLPDEDGPLRYYLPERPALAQDEGADEPALAATLLLDRQPRPDETRIGHLVRYGTVSFDLSLASPPAVRAALAETTAATEDGSSDAPDDAAGYEYRPLYAREATFDLLREDETLASTTASGAEARATVSATLDRDAALGFVAALRGETTDLRLRTTVSFRTADAPRRVTVRGTWSDVHDYLAARVAAESFTRDQLGEYFASMIEEGVVEADGEAPADALFTAFMRQSSVVLAETDEDRYTLRDRPHPGFGFTAVETVRSGGERSVTLEADLETVLGGALDGHDWDQFVRLYPLAADRPGAPVIPRTESTSPRRRGPGSDGPSRLAVVDGGARSVASQLAVDSSAAGLPRTGWRPAVAIDDARWQLLDDLRVGGVATTSRNLPVVGRGTENANAWPDRIDANRYWYAPTFEPVTPDSAAAPDGTFAFDCEVLGALPEGGRALRATVRFELEPTLPDDPAVAVLDERHELHPVELNDVSVTLDIPFFDRESRRTRRNRISGEATWDGRRLVAEVELVDEWVELCYGALSDADFQDLSAALTVTYAFETYQPIDEQVALLVVDEKTATLPVEYGDPGPDPSPVYFDASSATLHLPNRAVLLGARRAGTIDEIRDGSVRTTPAVDGGVRNASFPSVGATAVTPLTNVGTLIRPQHTLADVVNVGDVVLPVEPDDITLPVEPNYGVRTMRREESVDVVYPCETYGRRYRRTVAGETEAIGCDEAFRLDEITFRLYRRLPEALTPTVREHVRDVYQSRQQPDRYLVVPKRYRIDRHGPSEERPYRLRAMLHSTVSIDASESRCTFAVTLVPDVPSYVRRKLIATLAGLGGDEPVIEYPTAVTDDVAYEWLAGFGVESETDATPTVFESDRALYVHVETGLLDGHLLVEWLRSVGARGRATFTLDDGTVLPVDLELDLTRPTGPWEGGPVTVKRSGARAELSNPTRNTIDVTELQLYGHAPGAEGPSVPVETTLAPDESVEVTVPTEFLEAYPVYDQRPADTTELEERHLFVENITANVVFHTSANLEALGVRELRIEVGLAGKSEGTRSVGLSPGTPTGEVVLVLPLTSYLDRAVVRYRIEATYADDATARTDWIEWDLSSQGPIVYLTEEHLP